MQYFGGKARTCKEIAGILNKARGEGQGFLSPFVGGGWVEQYIEGEKILSDRHTYLIEMYKGLQRGWRPPTEVSEEEYTRIKTNKDEDARLTGFVGFGCSYSGKWFGGYARNSGGRNYTQNAYNSIDKKLREGLLEGSELMCCDYTEHKPEGKIIYCDPPYAGTTQYVEKEVGTFDSEVFWETMREWSRNNEVYISEYTAPGDFGVVWEKGVRTDIRCKEKGKQKRVERLYKYKGR